jgi:4-amino-4-deoxy-L-arabinose transferase-like glycosyltransferase
MPGTIVEPKASGSHFNEPDNHARLWKSRWSILALGVLIRILFLALFQTNPLDGADLQYWYGANNLVQTRVYSEFPFPSTVPTANCPPGYAIFIAVLLLIARGTWPVVAVQILMSAVACVIVFEITLLLGHRRAAQIAGFLYALASISLVQCCRIASETLFTLLILTALLSVLRAMGGKRFGLYLLSGLLLSLAALVRPIGLGLIIPWALLVLAKSSKGAILKAVAILFVSVIPLGTWATRNLILFEDPLLGGVNSDIVLGRYVAAWCLSRAENFPMEEARRQVGSLSNLQPSSSDLREFRARARSILWKHPYWWARAYLQGLPVLFLSLEPYGPGTFLRSLNDENTASQGIRDALLQGNIRIGLHQFVTQRWGRLPGRYQILYLWSISYALLTLVAGVAGVKRTVKDRGARASLFLIVAWIFWLYLAPCPQTSARFRMPAEPLFAILCGLGASSTLKNRRQDI